jgi:hypothetical protein
MELHMKINWKRVLIAGIWSEAALFVIYVAAQYAAGPARDIIVFLDWLGMPFLGGLWVARRIESRFILHGLLVGIITNILYFPLTPLIDLLRPENAVQAQAPQAYWAGLIWVAIASSFVYKMLGSTLGAYVGGRRRKKQLSAKDGKVST